MASPAVIASLLKDVSDGLRVWRDRDRIALTDEQILERARNIVNGLIGNYFISAMPEPSAVDWAAPEISGRPVGHGWSCRCDPCDTYKRSVRKDPS